MHPFDPVEALAGQNLVEYGKKIDITASTVKVPVGQRARKIKAEKLVAQDCLQTFGEKREEVINVLVRHDGRHAHPTLTALWFPFIDIYLIKVPSSDPFAVS